MIEFKFTIVDDEGFEEEVSAPAKYEVCGTCRGTGKHDHPAFSNGLTREDLVEDPDFRESYLRGDYDVQCSTCKGQRVVLTPDEQAMTSEQKAKHDQYLRTLADLARDERSERYLRMAESGGWGG